MSRGLNRVMLIGHVGADPELRTTTGGRRIATFPLATSRRFSGREGPTHEKTEWHRIVAWDDLAADVERFVRKGERVYVEGRIEYRTWEDQGGHTRYATEIMAQELVALGGPWSDRLRAEAPWAPHPAEPGRGEDAGGRERPQSPGTPQPVRDLEDDLPF